MPKYFCDYCDIYLTHDSPSVRRAHNQGWKHLMHVKEYYSELGHGKAQDVIDAITQAYQQSNATNTNSNSNSNSTTSSSTTSSTSSKTPSSSSKHSPSIPTIPLLINPFSSTSIPTTASKPPMLMPPHGLPNRPALPPPHPPTHLPIPSLPGSSPSTTSPSTSSSSSSNPSLPFSPSSHPHHPPPAFPNAQKFNPFPLLPPPPSSSRLPFPYPPPPSSSSSSSNPTFHSSSFNTYPQKRAFSDSSDPAHHDKKLKST